MNDDNESQSHIEHLNPKEKSQEQQDIFKDNKTIKITNVTNAINVKKYFRNNLTMRIQFGNMLQR